MCIREVARRHRGQYLLTQHVSGVGESREEVFRRELRVFLEDLRWCQPVGQAADQDPQWDAGTTDTCISVVEILGDDNMILPANTAHPAPLSFEDYHEQDVAQVAPGCGGPVRVAVNEPELRQSWKKHRNGAPRCGGSLQVAVKPLRLR